MLFDEVFDEVSDEVFGVFCTMTTYNIAGFLLLTSDTEFTLQNEEKTKVIF